MAEDWWNPNGKFKPLHLFNPARIEFIKKKLAYYYRLNTNKQAPLNKLKILDIGCGGGLLCEPLSRLGAKITGIDASKNNIEAAKLQTRFWSLGMAGKAFGLEAEDIKESFDAIRNTFGGIDEATNKFVFNLAKAK